MKTQIIDWNNLTDHFLIAMPSMADDAFSRALIYVCEHNEKGTLGLIINRPSDLSVKQLLQRLDLYNGATCYDDQPVFAGGPVQAERGFVLHESDIVYQSTLRISEDLSLTTSKDILEAVANGTGPSRWLMTLGYAGWGTGQLEQEMMNNAWLTVRANHHILFDLPLDLKFDAAFQELGINPLLMSHRAGHA